MKQIKSCFFIIPIFFAIFTSCKTKKIKSVAITDVFNHKILSQVGIDMKSLPEIIHEPDLYRYVEEFIADAKQRNVGISQESVERLRQVKYVDTLTSSAEPDVVATCSRYSLEQPMIYGKKPPLKWTVIEVLKKESQEFTQGHPVRLRELLYHEIFHCLMNKGHLPPGIDGIMSPVFHKEDKRAFKEWKILVDEMFSEKLIGMIPDADI